MGEDEDMFLSDFSISDLLARTADFLFKHSAWGSTHPQDAPPEVTDYFLHLAEHLLHYLGIVPNDWDFYTGHYNGTEFDITGAGRPPFKCSADYMRHITPSDLRNMAAQDGLSPDEEAAIKRTAEFMAKRKDNDNGEK